MHSASRFPSRPALATVVPFPRAGARGPGAFADPAELVAALLTGDPAAQSCLWDRHSPSARAVLRRLLGPGVDVDDALQEVFIELFRSARSLREPSALGGFVMGIAIRVAKRELRRRRIRRWFLLARDGEPIEAVAPNDPGRHQAREAVRRLYGILDELDDEGRMLFVLRHVEQLELTDVAAALKISLATVKRKLARVTPVVLARAKRDPELARFVGEDDAVGPRTSLEILRAEVER